MPGGAVAASAPSRQSIAGTEQVVLAGYFIAAPDFQELSGGRLRSVEPVGLLDTLPDEVLAEARRWERHIENTP